MTPISFPCIVYSPNNKVALLEMSASSLHTQSIQHRDTAYKLELRCVCGNKETESSIVITLILIPDRAEFTFWIY
jgi:hypothetical protein